MEQINKLLQKISAGTATTEDIDLLEAMQLNEEDEALKQRLYKEFNHSVAEKTPVLAPERTAAILARLHAGIEEEELIHRQHKIVRLRSRIVRMSAAAAVLLIMGIGYASYQQNKRRMLAAKIPAARETVTKMENNGKEVKRIVLADGSSVELAPGSTLSWCTTADHTTRRVQLEGKARFQVHANINNPFFVQTKDITTIALGTEFTVNTRDDKTVSVKLSQGKVLIRSASKRFVLKDIYLQPGEEFIADNTTNNITVKKAMQVNNSLATAVNRSVHKTRILANFDHAPLEQVLKKLETIFHTHIQYDIRDVEARYFTGSILQTDSLNNILAAICAMNQLKIKEDKESITISR